MSKLVYAFDGESVEGDSDMLHLLGGKGANLAEMSSIGLPVPPGFTITTQVCNQYTQKLTHAILIYNSQISKSACIKIRTILNNFKNN